MGFGFDEIGEDLDDPLGVAEAIEDAVAGDFIPSDLAVDRLRKAPGEHAVVTVPKRVNTRLQHARLVGLAAWVLAQDSRARGLAAKGAEGDRSALESFLELESEGFERAVVLGLGALLQPFRQAAHEVRTYVGGTALDGVDGAGVERPVADGRGRSDVREAQRGVLQVDADDLAEKTVVTFVAERAKVGDGFGVDFVRERGGHRRRF